MPTIADLITNLVRNVTDYGLERVFQRYYSIYRGEVMSIDDEEKRGRVKLRVPTLFGDKTLSMFAEPRDFRGAGSSGGEFWPPEVGDWVFVEFEQGDARLPVYSGGWLSKDEADAEFGHTGNAPNTRGFKTKYGNVFKFVGEAGKERIHIGTKKGNFLILDDSEGAEAIFLIHKSGAQLQIDPTGGLKIVAADGGFIALDTDSGALTASSKDGSTVALSDSILMLPKGGDVSLLLKEGLAQMTSAADMTLAANGFTISAGSVTVDAQGSTLKIGGGKVALGAAGIEVIDQVIQFMDALLTTPSLCTTAVGPSGPLSPPASVQITLLKTLLTGIKGSL